MIFKKSNPATDEAGTGLWRSLRQGLQKTRTLLTTDIRDLVGTDQGRQQLIDDLESRLLMADVGVETTTAIIAALDRERRGGRLKSVEDVSALLHQQMTALLQPVESPLQIPVSTARPFTILAVGVNGAGKTTTIAKIANLYRQDYRVIMAAGDTFRAAAIEQLTSWGERMGLPVVASQHGADSAAVIYDGLARARAVDADILIADTAGRLQNKQNLIAELRKIRQTISKFDPDLPVETLLVIDAGNGQNALTQAEQFHAEIGLDGIVLTKLDGTAKGGIIFAVARKLGIPVRFIGTGEKLGDISPFVASDYVSALLDSDR